VRGSTGLRKLADNSKVALSQHAMYLSVRRSFIVLPIIDCDTDIWYSDAEAFECSQSSRAESARCQRSSGCRDSVESMERERE
jgi:hypothetical protein